MAISKSENAKWLQAATAMVDQYSKARAEALEHSAALGFPAPTGAVLQTIFETGMEVKKKLTEANVKIYQEESERDLKYVELENKIALGWAKLALTAYKQGLLNRLTIEEAEAEASKTRARGDLERANSEIERRQADIIRLRADIEAEINYWRRQLVAAERLSLGAEAELIKARMQTAEEKLKTIEPIYEVIAAQDLVIKAEMRKASALEKVAEAEKRVAAIKKEMIPLYIQKAESRQTLAEATIREADVERARIELGYRRLALKDAEEAAEDQVRDAQLAYELAQGDYVRAETIRQMAQAEARTLLARYANDTQATIQNLKLELEKIGVDFKIESRLKRLLIDVEADIAMLLKERELQWKEYLERLKYITHKTWDERDTVLANLHTVLVTETHAVSWRRHGQG